MQAPGRKDIVAEIEAVTSLLRAQHEDKKPAAGPQDGSAPHIGALLPCACEGSPPGAHCVLRCRSVTHAVMQQRLEALQAALAALPEDGSDEDAWSDSSEEGQGTDKTTKKAAPAPAALLETERERHIRMGLITPFDNVAGAASGVRREGAAPEPAPLLTPAHQSAKLERTAKRLARQQAASEAARPAVKLMAPEELDEDMLQSVRKQEYFKQRASGEAAATAAAAAKAVRYKRAQTLPRVAVSKRKKRKVPAPQGRRGGGSEDGSDEEEMRSSLSDGGRADAGGAAAARHSQSADSDADSLALPPASSSDSDDASDGDDYDDAGACRHCRSTYDGHHAHVSFAHCTKNAGWLEARPGVCRLRLVQCARDTLAGAAAAA